MARRYERSDEMSFEEFKQSMAAFPSGYLAVIDEFKRLIRSGYTVAEAKQWLMLHISEFPEGLRESVMTAFAEDTLQQAEEQEMDREFMEIWKTQGFPAAKAWVKQQRALRAKKGE